jgi:hypothetical protein
MVGLLSAKSAGVVSNTVPRASKEIEREVAVTGESREVVR